MRPIDHSAVQTELNERLGRPQYLHLETTTGSYTKFGPEKKTPVIAFVRNAQVTYSRGTITGTGPYRVGLKLDDGWVYADGLTDYEVNGRGELLNDTGVRHLSVKVDKRTSTFSKLLDRLSDRVGKG